MNLKSLKTLGRFAFAGKARAARSAGDEGRMAVRHGHPDPDRPHPGVYALLVGVPRR